MELVPLCQSFDLDMYRWGDFAHFDQSPQTAKELHTCCIRSPKRIGTNCGTRSFANFYGLQHQNPAFPDRGSLLNIDLFAVLYNILSVVGVFGTPCICSITACYLGWDTFWLRLLQGFPSTVYRESRNSDILSQGTIGIIPACRWQQSVIVLIVQDAR